jgi:hypothetical protein
MTKSGSVSRFVAFRASIQRLIRFTGCFGLMIALLAGVAATSPSSQSPDEQYLDIMSIIDRADALRTAGQADAAHVKYLQAEKALLAFKSANPLFSPRTVAYRLKEVTERADERPAIPAQTNAASTASAAPAAAPAKSNVKLLEAGAEPRSVLRYHVKPGDKQVAILTMKTKLDLPATAAGQAGATVTPANNPGISIPMDITVQNIAANGDITYVAVMGEATLLQDTNTTPENVQAMQAAVAGIKGITATTIMSNRGVTKKSEIKAPATASPQARQLADQMKQVSSAFSMELPEEPVGSGAKWEVKEQTKVQASSVEETRTYEMTSVDGDKLTAKLSAGVDSGSKAAASGVSGSASGTVNADLSKAVAPSAEVNVHTELPMGRDKNAIMKMDVSISIQAQ